MLSRLATYALEFRFFGHLGKLRWRRPEGSLGSGGYEPAAAAGALVGLFDRALVIRESFPTLNSFLNFL